MTADFEFKQNTGKSKRNVISVMHAAAPASLICFTDAHL
jgi:hypothetical protein